MPRMTRQPDAGCLAERKRSRLDGELRRGGGLEVERARPLDRHSGGSLALELSGASDEEPAELAGRHVRSGVGEERGRAGDDSRGGARAGGGREARRAVAGAACVRGREPDAGCDEVRLHTPVEDEAA